MAGGESVRRKREHVFVQTVHDHVLALLAAGRSVAEVALELGIAPNTVRYHRSRPEAATAARPSPAPAAAVREVGTRAAVERLLRDGLPRAEIARRLGIGKATVSYHARRLGHTVDRRCARRYDWAAVRRYYEAGHSVDQCVAVFGFSRHTWHAAVRRGDVVPRPAALAPADLFAARTPRSTRPGPNGSPSSRSRCWKWLIIMIPFRAAMPITVKKPISAPSEMTPMPA